MVEIQEEEPSGESSPDLVAESQTPQNNKETNDGSGWDELMGKDLRMKVVQRGGSAEPGQSCEVGDAVRVDFVGYYAEKCENDEWEMGPVFQEANDWMVIVVDKDVCPALEMGIRFLQEGDHAIIQSHSKYAFGPAGRKHGEYVLPPHSSVIYKVHINSITKGESKEFSTANFQIECSLNKKMIGNDCYQNEWSDGFGKGKALQLYRKGADIAKRAFQISVDKEEKEKAREVLMDCLNNSAAVHMRAKEYNQAKEAATQVLLQDPTNLKGLTRAARATMYDPASSYEESDAAISAAEKEYGDDADVKKLRAELERRKQEYNKKSKAMFSKMAKAMKSGSRGKRDKATPEKVIEKSPAPEDTPEKEVEESGDVAADSDLPWFQRNQHKLAFHIIVLLIQMCFFIYLKKKSLIMPLGGQSPEPPTQQQQLNLETEF